MKVIGRRRLSVDTTTTDYFLRKRPEATAL